MLTCKEATYKLSEAQDRKLALAERIDLKMHLMMCKGCANYRKQIDFMRYACKSYADSIVGDKGGGNKS